MERVGRREERSARLKVSPVWGIKINTIQVLRPLSGERPNDAELTRTK